MTQPFRQIVERTAALYGLTFEDLMIRGKKSLVLQARDHAMYEVWIQSGRIDAVVKQYFQKSNVRDVQKALMRHVERITALEAA